jgi:pilus assembly protein CpaF
VINAELRTKIITDVLEQSADGPYRDLLHVSLLNELGPDADLDPSFQNTVRTLREELEGLGPLDRLLADQTINEILVNNFETIYFERQGVLHRNSEAFSCPATLNRAIRFLLLKLDRTADRRFPLTDGTLSDGTRVHIALPPVTQAPTISLRKHRLGHWKMPHLVKAGMFSEKQADRFQMWVAERKNILVCGPTGSGKTTLLRALLDLVPEEERLVVLEDTPELGLSGPQAVTLFTREDPQGLAPPIDLNLLLRNALRMRPDRIIVGEVRGTEALILLDALATGHRGSMSSMHALSPRQALFRLESLVNRASPQWPLQAVRQLIADSVEIVVCLTKKNGLRMVSQAAELTGVESFGYLLNSFETD